MKTHTSRFHRSLTAGLALVTFLTPAAPSRAVIEGCASNLAPEARVHIVEVEAIGEDLRVVMAWEDDDSLPGAAPLKVRDAEGKVVAQKVVNPLPGQITEELLPGALEDVADDGLAYTVEIGNGLMEPYPFRAALSCPPGGCGWLLSGGVSAEAVVVDRDLAPILDLLETAGATNVLVAALALAPDLIGEIASLAIDLGQLDDRIGIATGAGACSCAWTYAEERDPVAYQPFRNTVPESVEAGGYDGPGAAHTAGVQTVNSATDHAASGTTRLGMELRCWEFLSWNPLTVTLPGGAETIQMPELAPCAAPCGGTVTHEVVFETRLEAQGVTFAASFNDPDSTASPTGAPAPDPNGCGAFAACATAHETVTYSIDGQAPLIDEDSTTAVRLPLEADRIEVDCLQDSALQSRPEPSEARLDTYGLADVEATGGFAFAEVRNLYSMAALGSASCALEQDVHVEVLEVLGASLGEVDGGVQVQPWCRP